MQSANQVAHLPNKTMPLTPCCLRQVLLSNSSSSSQADLNPHLHCCLQEPPDRLIGGLHFDSSILKIGLIWVGRWKCDGLNFFDKIWCWNLSDDSVHTVTEGGLLECCSVFYLAFGHIRGGVQTKSTCLLILLSWFRRFVWDESHGEELP